MSDLTTILLAGSAVALTSVGIVGSYTYKKIYEGEYLEQAPIFGEASLSPPSEVEPEDDITQSKILEFINPNDNEVLYDYHQKKLDIETTRKILSKFNTRDEILTQLEKGIFSGYSLFVHRNIISRYLKSFGDHNRIVGLTGLEPELKELNLDELPKIKFLGLPVLPESDKVKYIWNYGEIQALNDIIPLHTIIFGVFTLANYGKRTNGGFFEFAFASDLLPMTAIRRVEYFTVNHPETKEPQLVVRFTSAAVLVQPDTPKFTDKTKGFHEFLTRCLVLDAIKGLTSAL